MGLTGKQKGVLSGMVLACGVMGLGLGGGIWLSPDILVPVDDLHGRLAFAMKWDLLVVFFLLATIATLARRRFFSPEDIDGGGLGHGTPQVRIHQSILQNTLEQVVLAIPVHVACAVLLPVHWLAIVPVAAILFALGRILFWRGYQSGAPSRALGFALTFYPTVVLFALVAVRTVATL